ncbi:MAG: DUF6807 family protein [Candidatus Aminicenantes bacterium]
MTKANPLSPLIAPLLAALCSFAVLGLAGCRGEGEGGPAGPRAGSAGAPEWRFERVDGESLALAGPSGVVWRFNCSPELDVPYFHPLATLDGRILTADRPTDHVWHHGLWFSWKFIDGVNYWEIDRATGRPAGRTSWRDVDIATGDDGGSARISLSLFYRPAGEGEEAAVLREERTIAVAAPDAEGVTAIDWAGTFTAVRDIVLDRTPLPGEPGGQIWGGYAGLSARLADGLADRRPVTSDGPVVEMPDDRYRGRHAALDYSFLIGGQPAGVAVIDHPENPGSPTPWYVIRSDEMSFLTPAVICYGPMALRAGETITLRYRVFVHTGRWDAARLRTEHERFPLTSAADDETRRRDPSVPLSREKAPAPAE